MRMRKIILCSIISMIILIFASGCTLQSTKIAQDGSFRSQAVLDGVHRDIFKALSRENFETAKLNLLLEAEKLKEGKSTEEKTAIDQTTAKMIAGLTEFAKKRDFMVEWDRDHERAVCLKFVTVDSKLFSEQGILNYLGNTISDASKKFWDAWDETKKEWNLPNSEKK